MSSDDFISIREDDKREYDVYHKSMDGCVIHAIGHHTNLREAMIAAEDYQDEQEFGVEYGIRFFPKS